MKLYIFQETGEFREIKKGEWYQSMVGDFFAVSDRDDSCKRKIFVMTEVEAFDNVDTIRITMDKGCVVPTYHVVNIPIVRPKQKIKKWQWVYKTFGSSKWLISGYYKTKDEVIADTTANIDKIKKLEESEIEVEE